MARRNLLPNRPLVIDEIYSKDISETDLYYLLQKDIKRFFEEK